MHHRRTIERDREALRSAIAAGRIRSIVDEVAFFAHQNIMRQYFSRPLPHAAQFHRRVPPQSRSFNRNVPEV